MSPGAPPSVVILVPRLLQPPGGRQAFGAARTANPHEQAALHALETALSRADRVPGIGKAGAALASTAMLSRAGEGVQGAAQGSALAVEEVGRGHWLRADPVHMRPDLAGMSMIPVSSFDLDAQEAHALVCTLNELFENRDLRFEAPVPSRWYIRSPVAFEIETTPPAGVSDQTLSHALPRGARAAYWHGVLNEAQMALHAARTNLTRAARNAPAVNSIWLWGEQAHAGFATADCGRVCSNDPIVRGTARFGGAQARILPAQITKASLEGQERVLFHVELAASPETLAAFSRAWLTPGISMLRAGQLESVTIDTGDGRAFRLDRAAQRRFWRRRRPLDALFDAAPEPKLTPPS